MKGRICVITGATSGIGRASALSLGALGAHVIALGRNQSAGEALVQKLDRLNGAGTAEFLRVDLSDQNQVRDTATQIRSRHARIHVLINNAGARNDRLLTSAQGIESTFACNHLAHFLFTALLLEGLIAAPSARVITVSSGGHDSSFLNSGWAPSPGTYNRRQAYARSKLANIFFAVALAERLKLTNITSNAYNPGGVASNFSRNNGLVSWGRHLMAHGLRRDLISPRKAAAGIVRLACAPDPHPVSGRWFRRNTEASLPQSYTAQLANDLWQLSLQLTHLDEGIGPIAWDIFGSKVTVSAPNSA